MIQEAEEKVYDVLRQLEIDYERYEHMAVYTMEELNIADLGVKGLDCKNLFIKNRKGDRHYLVVVPGAQRINLKSLGAALDAIGLSFASEERMRKYLGLTPGAVSPFGLIHDQAKEVNVVLDQRIVDADYVNFHPNVNTATITLSAQDFLKFLHWCGNKTYFIDLLD